MKKISIFINLKIEYIFLNSKPNRKMYDENNNTDDKIDNLANNISSKLKIDKRPTFFIDKKPIRASGILCYVYDNVKKKKIWLLRRENKILTSYYCDTGGKTDAIDKSPIDTAIRETIEETNGHLFSKKHSKKKCLTILKNLIEKDVDVLYIKESKYLLHLLKLRFNTMNKPMYRFGISEKLLGDESKTHTYFWLDELPFDDLHPRLKNIYNIIK